MTNSPSYKSACTLTKAVKRAKSALPNSPHKRATVLKKLSLEAGCLEVAFPQAKQGTTSIPEYVKTVVTEFILRDDISEQAPGKRDTIVVRENNTKKTM